MELKSPKAKKKSPVNVTWKKMLRTPVLLLLLLGSINCDSEDVDISKNFSDEKIRHRSRNVSDVQSLNDIRYLRRHLNREIVNFVMTDFLIDGEVENRVHYNGVTAKETLVGADG